MTFYQEHMHKKVVQTDEEIYQRRLNGETLKAIAQDNNVGAERIRQRIVNHRRRLLHGRTLRS